MTNKDVEAVERIIAALRRRAKNLERYPFESATMAEAATLAAYAIYSTIAEIEETPADD